ncbi:MAG: hypothetical protein KatS3mg126_1024 [Lysobacteraceae bacterium]|nr:MAG: hypothetical protein KatS3mg126_1024 [Xanthomonadaceae bacterium]
MAARLARLLLWGLVVLQAVWYLALDPPAIVPAWLALSLAWLPLLPAVLLQLRGARTAPFWSGVLALPYFCHGVMEAWAVPALRLPGLLEAIVASALVLAVGADGLQRRRAARQAAPRL